MGDNRAFDNNNLDRDFQPTRNDSLDEIRSQTFGPQSSFLNKDRTSSLAQRPDSMTARSTASAHLPDLDLISVGEAPVRSNEPQTNGDTAADGKIDGGTADDGAVVEDPDSVVKPPGESIDDGPRAEAVRPKPKGHSAEQPPRAEGLRDLDKLGDEDSTAPDTTGNLPPGGSSSPPSQNDSRDRPLEENGVNGLQGSPIAGAGPSPTERSTTTDSPVKPLPVERP